MGRAEAGLESYKPTPFIQSRNAPFGQDFEEGSFERSCMGSFLKLGLVAHTGKSPPTQRQETEGV